MRLNTTSRFDLKTNTPQKGAECGLWLNADPQEVLDAEAAGTGPGVPATNGTPTQGTMNAGQIVEMNSNGGWILATQCIIGTDMPKIYFCIFTGNNDFSFNGRIFVFQGGRFETPYIDADTYTPGMPLVVSPGTPGNLSRKLLANDNVKHIAYVGPRGQRPNNTVDVLMPQSS